MAMPNPYSSVKESLDLPWACTKHVPSGGNNIAGKLEEVDTEEGRAQRWRQQQGRVVHPAHGASVGVAQYALLGGAGSDEGSS